MFDVSDSAPEGGSDPRRLEALRQQIPLDASHGRLIERCGLAKASF